MLARPRTTLPDPELPDCYLLDEDLTVEIGGHALSLGDTGRARIMRQPPMPGFEDVLLGRDFLAQHGLLLVLDAQGEEFSLLLPADDENRRRRADILAAVTLPEAPAGGTDPASVG